MPDLTKAIEVIGETVGKAIARVEDKVLAQVKGLTDAFDAYRQATQASINDVKALAERIEARAGQEAVATLEQAKAYADEKLVTPPTPEQVASAVIEGWGDKLKGAKGDTPEVDPELVRAAVEKAIPATADVAKLVVDEVAKWKPELKGDPGARGEKGDTPEIDVAVIQAAVDQAVPKAADVAKLVIEEAAAWKPELKGDPGEPGQPGIVDDAVIHAAVQEALPPLVAEARAALEGQVTAWKPELKGERGAKGEKGDSGESVIGPRGDVGPPGKGAYELAVEKGFIGDDAAWLASLVGERGAKGEAGESIKGEQGEKGDRGESIKGDRGSDGLSTYEIAKQNGFAGSALEWLDSIRGKDGLPGRDGRDAKDGEPGRDALQIDVLPVIDETRSYPRGTFARVRGAYCRAAKQTQAIKDGSLEAAGWQVLVDAPLPDITVELGEDLRTFTISTAMASGAVTAKSFKVPVVLDRGLWDKKRGYEPGDMTTYAGQIWLATAESKDVQPGTSPVWRLSVRKGRDAAGTEGDKGPPPPVRLR